MTVTIAVTIPIYIYIYICIHMCVCMYVYIYIYTHVDVYIYIYMYMYTHIYLRRAQGTSSRSRRWAAARAPVRTSSRARHPEATNGRILRRIDPKLRLICLFYLFYVGLPASRAPCRAIPSGPKRLLRVKDKRETTTLFIYCNYNYMYKLMHTITICISELY